MSSADRLSSPSAARAAPPPDELHTTESIISHLRHNERLFKLHEKHLKLRGETSLPDGAIEDNAMLAAMEGGLRCFPKYSFEDVADIEQEQKRVAARGPVEGADAAPQVVTLSETPRLRELLPAAGLTEAEAALEAAADAFDDRHAASSGRADRRLSRLRKGAAEREPEREKYNAALQEVRRNRFVAPERPKSPPRATGPPRRPKATKPPSPERPTWKLEESVWAGRPKGNDSRGWYDSDAVLRRAVERDWGKAVHERGLGKYILKKDDGDDDGVLDAEGESTEITEVLEVLVRHAELLFATYAFYAAGSGGGNVFRLSQTAWLDFATDIGLAVAGSKDCQSTHLATLFIAVNANDKGAQSHAAGAGGGARGAPQEKDARRTLNRHEWLEILVRAAVARYVLSGELRDVSEAVRTLLGEVVAPHLPAQAPTVAAASAFRARCCYTAEVDAVLRRHEESLRVMFDRYAQGGGDVDGLGVLMGLDEWREFCEDLGLLDEQFTLREATLVFLSARLLVVDEGTAVGWRRATNLGWEDFLDAFVRMSTLVPLPTDAELETAGCRDAGVFVVRMRERDPADWKEFGERSAVPWGGTPRMPISRCVEGLCMVMIRTVEGGTQFEDDARITQLEAKEFDARR